MELMKWLIDSMNEDEVSITLALLQKRQCELNPKCKECSWKGSILCIPIRSHLEREKDRMNEKAKERNEKE